MTLYLLAVSRQRCSINHYLYLSLTIQPDIYPSVCLHIQTVASKQGYKKIIRNSFESLAKVKVSGCSPIVQKSSHIIMENN